MIDTAESPTLHAWEGLPEDVLQSRLYNQDLAPTTLAQRTWSVWSITALWVSMCACIPTYLLASGLIDEGMNWWQAILTIFLANVIVLIPMVLNAHAGTKYGIPFPVFCRASFGTTGANVPAMVRALVGCGWFGIQSWIGGAALFAIACIFKPEWASAPHLLIGAYDLGISAPQFLAFLAFWLVNIVVIFAGINSIRKGQMEAALAMGMSRRQAMFKVLVPQAARRILPVLASTWISLFKDTSLVSVIAVSELAYASMQVRAQSFRVLEMLTAMAVIYWLMGYPQAKLVDWIHRKYGVKE